MFHLDDGGLFVCVLHTSDAQLKSVNKTELIIIAPTVIRISDSDSLGVQRLHQPFQFAVDSNHSRQTRMRAAVDVNCVTTVGKSAATSQRINALRRHEFIATTK